MTASALPRDEEEAVLTHDLELVVDLHADDKFRPSWAPRGQRRRLAVRPQELPDLAERLVVTRVVVLHRPSERLRRDVRVQPPLLRHPNHGKVRTELAAKVAMADVHIASANAKSSNRADSKGFCFYRKISGRVGYKTASDASKWILFLMTSPPRTSSAPQA